MVEELAGRDCGSASATGVLTYLQGALKLKTLLTRTKHLQIASPSHACHKGFTQMEFASRALYSHRPSPSVRDSVVCPTVPGAVRINAMLEKAVQAPAIGAPVTDASPKGLIPQLTELLHALTDSQELLVHKLRTLQGQHRNDSDTVIEWALRTDAFHSESRGLAESRPPVLLDAQTDDGSAQRHATENPEIRRANGSTGLRYARGRHAVTDERALVELEEAIRTETDTPKAPQSQGDVIVPRRDTNRAPAHA